MKKVYRFLLLGLLLSTFNGCNRDDSSISSLATSSSNDISHSFVSISELDNSSSSIASSISSSIDNNSSTIDPMGIKNIEVKGYKTQHNYLTKFNENDITMEVTFNGGKKEKYTGYELVFEYGTFNPKAFGKHSIKISVPGTQISKTIEVEVVPAESLSILMIGNSYSDDTVQWVNEICDSLDIEVKIANLYIGGCTLNQHYNNLKNNSSSYEFVTYNSSTKSWSRRSSTSIKYGLESYDWDFVSLQQGSHESGLPSTYEKLNDIMDYVLEIKDDISFVWNMTWAYQQNSGHSNFGNYNSNQLYMYESIVDTVKNKIEPNDRIEAIIPNGTAVQNARTSFVGDNLCRDVYCHLTYDFGRYIAGLGLVSTLTARDISNITYAPGSMSKEYRQIAIESVNNALAKPYEVTNSKYTSEPTQDLSGLVEIDYKPIGCAYYYSTHVTNHSKLTTNAGNSMNFVATKLFTKEELPIGSIIEVTNGYQYRPEGWVNFGEVQSSRMENVTTKYVEVTNEWWGNYTVRAFNISSASGTSLVYKWREAIDSFKIYVPIDSYEEDNTNEFLIGDTALFANNSLDINNYEQYDYDFCNGFYNSSAHNNQQIDFDDSNGGPFASKFICSEPFTKETLPVGSVLIVDDGYKYRPDGWVGANINNSRPSDVTTNFTVVDELWWGNYTIRGFNLSRVDGTVIHQIPYEATSHFRIYIPK